MASCSSHTVAIAGKRAPAAALLARRVPLRGHRINQGLPLFALSKGALHAGTARTAVRWRLGAAAQATATVPAPPTAALSSNLAAEDIVVVGAVRTPSCRARKGALKDVRADDMIATVLKEVVRRAGIKPGDVGDICFGSVFPSSSKRANEARIAMLLAGFPASVPIYTVNRQCAAGLQAIANVAAHIRAGHYSIGIAGGVESLTKDPLIWEGADAPDRVSGSQDALDVMMPLGLTAENVADSFGVAREEQDTVAAASHAKAAAAQADGKFKEEIVPIETTVVSADGKEQTVVVEDDDGIRPDSSYDNLSKLKPYFRKGGSVTVGNSCQNTDCAAALVLTTRGEAERRGLPIMATLRSFAVVGVPPAVMGIGSTVAVPAVLRKAGLTTDDVDIYEINESFGSQAAYCVRELGLPEEKVNPNGGGIALGHPAGCTGARLAVTLLHEMARRNGRSMGGSVAGSAGSLDASSSGSAASVSTSVSGTGSVDALGSSNGNGSGKGARYGLISICTGSGMGAAAVFEAATNGNSNDEA